MSSLLSISSRTVSTMTTRSTTSGATTSTPHTPSSSSVVTGLRASLGTGPFFHAHLQEGQRIEDESPSEVSYEVSAYAIGPKGVVTSNGVSPLKSKKLNVNVCEGQPHVSQRHDSEKTTSGMQAAASSTFTSTPNTGVQQHQASLSRAAAKKWTRSTSATPASANAAGFWKMVEDVQAAVGGESRTPKQYHYITRSQSAGAAADAAHFQPAPKMRKQNASYTPGFGTSAYPDNVGNAQLTSTEPPAGCPPRGRYLSPIEEVQFFPERNGDSVSLHSTTSAQSNLFIHRSVRRTHSASTLNSGHSVTPRSPDDPTVPYYPSPSRSYGPSRSVAALPVIPASPRESQNVFEQDPVSLKDPSLAYPMPVVYPSGIEYTAYQQPEEQDLGDTLSSLQFAVPHYRYDYNTDDEQDLGKAQPPRISMPHSRTPSLLTRSESIRTELTYLTAQDSGPNSRRASGVPRSDDLEMGRLGRSAHTDGDTTLVNTSAKPSPAARLKASIDTFLSKSPKKMDKSPGGINGSPTADASSTLSVQSKVAKLLLQMNEAVKKRAPWGEGNGKPAEMLFWTGFLAPWCWLIGGWMLARGGGTMAEGLSRGAKEPVLPLHNQQRHPQETQNLPENGSTGNDEKQASSIWQAAKNSSVGFLDSLRGHNTRNGNKTGSTTTVRAVAMHGDVPVSIMISTRVDPWVVRCRVAAVFSGMLILALCIVALVVLVRSI